MSGRIRALLLALAVLAGSLAPASIATAAASASAPQWDCDSGVGTRTPVVLVHGYNANAGSWSPATRELLAAPAARFCTTAFDYGPASTFWVTDRRIAAALAARVLALANASTRAGGSGKVVVVAHSMGGLAIRCASSSACGGNDAAGSALRAVVTFDTPNLGAFLKGYGLSHAANTVGNTLSTACRAGDPFDANPVLKGICGQIRALGTSDAAEAFTPGSDELRDLPPLPTGVPVLAVAGSVKLGTSFWGREPKILGDVGDLIVNEDSAFAAARTVGGIGGKEIRDCGVLDLTSNFTMGSVIPVSQPQLTCTHVSETNNPDWTVLVTKLKVAINPPRPPPVPPRLSAGALGGARIGMTVEQVEQALAPAGMRPTRTTDDPNCLVRVYAGGGVGEVTLVYQAASRRLFLIDDGTFGTRSSPALQTDRGVGIGTTAAKALAAYPEAATTMQPGHGPVMAVTAGGMTLDLMIDTDAGEVYALRTAATEIVDSQELCG